MKYNLLVEEYISKLSNLQRVRIKVDPKALTKEADLQNLPAYEGFILEEGLTHVKVLILPPEMQVSEIPIELIEYIAAEDKEDLLCDLKKYIITALNLADGDPLLHKIEKSVDLNEIESLLKQTGVEDDQLVDIYKEFILS